MRFFSFYAHSNVLNYFKLAFSLSIIIHKYELGVSTIHIMMIASLWRQTICWIAGLMDPMAGCWWMRWDSDTIIPKFNIFLEGPYQEIKDIPGKMRVVYRANKVLK